MVRRTSRAPRARLVRSAFGCVALLATATGQGGGYPGPPGGFNGGRTRAVPHDPPAASRPRPPGGGTNPTRATRSSMRYSDAATCGPYCIAWFGDCYTRTLASQPEDPLGTAHSRALEACSRGMYQASGPPYAPTPHPPRTPTSPHLRRPLGCNLQLQSQHAPSSRRRRAGQPIACCFYYPPIIMALQLTSIPPPFPPPLLRFRSCLASSPPAPFCQPIYRHPTLTGPTAARAAH